MPFLGCPGPWDSTVEAPQGEAVQPGQGRAGAGCSLGLQCRLCCALQSPDTKHLCLCQTGLGPGCSSWTEFDTGSFSSFLTREGAEGRGDPCHCCSARDTGRGVLLHPCMGVVLPAATLAALSASEVPTDDPCLKGHIPLASLHPSVLIWECQSRAGLLQTYSGCARAC